MSITRNSGLLIAAIVALLFGVLTVVSGARALFGGVEARAAMGDIVPFVLWFNFLAGFAYVTTGIGLILQHRWSVWLSIVILAGTTLVLALFGVHVAQGGAFEMRTVGAMILRTTVWVAISALALQHLARGRHTAN